VSLLCHGILVCWFVQDQIVIVADVHLNPFTPSSTQTHTRDRSVTDKHGPVIHIVKYSKLLVDSLICINIVIKSPHKLIQ
jgi:hypothetical protein